MPGFIEADLVGGRFLFPRSSFGLLAVTDSPEQYRAIGWVGDRLYSVIFEVGEDRHGEYYRLITLWKATREEQELYEASKQA